MFDHITLRVADLAVANSAAFVLDPDGNNIEVVNHHR